MVDSNADARSPRVLALLCSLVVALALLPGAAAAAPSLADSAAPQTQQVGGDVVVGPDETVSDDLSVAAGDVIVRGTVDGDVDAAAGSVTVIGEVTGDVDAAAGSVTVDGRVGGGVEAAAGSVEVGSDGVVGEDVEAAARTVTVAGTVDGDVTGSETVRLRDGASVGGDVTYGETLDRAAGAMVGGETIHDERLGSEWSVGTDLDGLVLEELTLLPAPFAGLVTGLAGLVVGAVVLLVAPEFSTELVETARADTAQSGAAGLATLVGVPVVLVAVAITVIGIPFALAGGALFAAVAWVALVLGEYAVGSVVLGSAGVDNRWAALFVGVVGVETVALVPLLGDVVTFAVVVLGLGAAALAVARRRRGDGAEGVETPRPDTDLRAA